MLVDQLLTVIKVSNIKWFLSFMVLSKTLFSIQWIIDKQFSHTKTAEKIQSTDPNRRKRQIQ